MAGLSVNSFGDVKENPYYVISTRNSFGLQAVLPLETVKTPEPAASPPREIRLTGITTLAGAAKALPVASTEALIECDELSRALPRSVGAQKRCAPLWD